MNLNEVSGEELGDGLRSAERAAARVMSGLRQWTGRVSRGEPPKQPVTRRPAPARRQSAGGSGGRSTVRSTMEEWSLRFVVEPLSIASVVRPEHEPHVLYVRLATPAGDHVAVMPDVAAHIRAEIERASSSRHPVQRAVLVGADTIVDPRAVGGPGHAEALGTLVEALGAFAAAHVPFVWRTRGGIDGNIPHALGQALVDAGTLARVELGVPTLDPDLCTALEGHVGAHPEHRLRLAAALATRGVAVRGLVDPLVPMLTDQQASMEALMAAFADAGVTRIGARYIVLTRERARAVASRLAGMQRALLQGVFADEPWHKPDPESGHREVHKRIPAHLRRSGHHRLLEAGARHGLFVDVLDPVEEGEDLTAGPIDAAPEKPKAEKPRADKRRRPQLELFRKTR